MYYYMYQITNLIDGKIYIGVHKTENLNDGYMGSGILLRKAQEKYGAENFEKKILESFSSLEEMFTREAEIVTPEFLERKDVYNLATGGRWPGQEAVRRGYEIAATSGLASKGGCAVRDAGHGIFSEEGKRKQLATAFSEKNKEHLRDICQLISTDPDVRRKHKESLARIGHAKGEKNSQYGTMWITNGIDNKKIRKVDPIPEGWIKGRKIKKN